MQVLLENLLPDCHNKLVLQSAALKCPAHNALLSCHEEGGSHLESRPATTQHQGSSQQQLQAAAAAAGAGAAAAAAAVLDY
jgi:hypothetical protein